MRSKFLLLFLLTIFLLPEQFLISQQIKFAVIGDYGKGGSAEADVSDIIDTWNVHFVITLGDNNYNDGLWSTIDNNIGKDYNQWIKPYVGSYPPGGSSDINRFFPSPGNHDHHNLNSLSYLQPYLDYFDLTPYSGSSSNERYYDFVWDNIHFFSVNSCSIEPDGYKHPSTQSAWLETQMTNCIQNHLHWRIVYFHHSPYSSQKQVFNLRWPFKEWGAHIVLSGHSHTYERLEIGGLTNIVNGLGGKNIGDFGTIVLGSEVRYNGDFGAVLFETIGETQLRGQFIDVNGVQRDNFTITETGLPVELAFFVGALNGNKVELRWRTETEVNNYGFSVERTTDNLLWLTLGFVEGHGNSNSPKQYNFIDTDIRQSGKYYYKLKQIDNDGTFEYSDVVTVTVGVSVLFALSQNYPNPFNPETRIDYTLPEKQLVSLRIYNSLGELVRELVNEVKESGSYSVTFHASMLPSGIYIYRIQTESFATNKKMTFLK